jgi:hypothetical protein
MGMQEPASHGQEPETEELAARMTALCERAAAAVANPVAAEIADLARQLAEAVALLRQVLCEQRARAGIAAAAYERGRLDERAAGPSSPGPPARGRGHLRLAAWPAARAS